MQLSFPYKVPINSVSGRQLVLPLADYGQHHIIITSAKSSKPCPSSIEVITHVAWDVFRENEKV